VRTVQLRCSLAGRTPLSSSCAMAPSLARLLAATAGCLHGAAALVDADAQALIQSRLEASQPEYAKPVGYVHGYEKAKNFLVRGGTEIDNVFKMAKNALQNLSFVGFGLDTPRVNLSRTCNLSKSEPQATQLFMVDNANLQAATNGMGYRFRKITWDRDIKTIARWGSMVEGVDHGDGWVQVGDCFLPTTVQDKPVLKLQQTRSKLAVADPTSLIEIDGAPVMYRGPTEKQDRPREVELSQASGEDMLDRNGVAVGDRMEVMIKSGDHNGQAVEGIVEERDAEKDLYDLYLPHAPEGHRHVRSIPYSWLRRPDESAGKDGVLLFWAVTSKPSTMDLVTKNIDHLRSTYRGKADVFLLHIDDGKAEWLESDGAWYSRNVQFTAEQTVPKFAHASSSMLYATSFYPPQVRLAKSALPQVMAGHDYKWVWIVDQDVDFSTTDLDRLFSDADKSGSLIVAPAVSFEDRLTTLKAATKMYAPGCSPANAMCFIHKPKPICQYRYVNFVEAMFPIMKPAAFREMLACEDCDAQIDRHWCTRPAVRILHDHNQVCAILDQVTVTHTNGKTLRKWEAVDQSYAGQRALSGPRGDYVEDIATLKCVP